MSLVSKLRSAALIGAAASVLAASGALAQDFEQPFFGGAYVPGPTANQGVGFVSGYGAGVGLGPVGIGGGVRAVGYDEGYYYGGYQYPAAGYGGGPYRRAAYSAADVYVTRDPCDCVEPRIVCRPPVRAYHQVRAYHPPPRHYRIVRRPPVARHFAARTNCRFCEAQLY
jgi:hypothetical protein